MSSYLREMFGWSTATETEVTPRLHSKNPRGMCDFRPQLFYQPVQVWHLAGSSLEFKINLTTGINQARFANDADLEAPGSEEALESAMRNAVTLVKTSESDGEEGEGEVKVRLVNAVTWQDPMQVKYILQSCYVTHHIALPALAEACSRGLEECVQILLQAGTSASCYYSLQQQQQGGGDSGLQKNALHVACENGHESCARMLINSMQSREEVYLKTKPAGLTAFDILRQQDLSGMARRLELHAENHLTERHNP